MERTVLLLVDLQRALIEEHPDHEQQLLERAQRLLKEARTRGIEAVFVRHDGSARGTLIPGSAGWELHPAVSPLPGERIFDKRFCSAFRGTGLRDYLRDRGISRIVLIGMQTEYDQIIGGSELMQTMVDTNPLGEMIQQQVRSETEKILQN